MIFAFFSRVPITLSSVLAIALSSNGTRRLVNLFVVRRTILVAFRTPRPFGVEGPRLVSKTKRSTSNTALFAFGLAGGRFRNVKLNVVRGSAFNSVWHLKSSEKTNYTLPTRWPYVAMRVSVASLLRRRSGPAPVTCPLEIGKKSTATRAAGDIRFSEQLRSD